MRCIIYKILFGVFGLILAASAFATANIGVTDLRYADGVYSNSKIQLNIQVESGTMANVNKFNNEVMTKLSQRLLALEPQVAAKLNSDKNFTTYNAESIFSQSIKSSPQLLQKLMIESGINNVNESATESVNTIPAKESQSYVLVGVVTNIKSELNKQLFAVTDKKSILYNLDILIMYKIIDLKTQNIVAMFYVKGHGGYTTIVPVSATINNYDPNIAVDNAVTSLLDSILHGMLLKKDLGDI